jgi:hypothetical protein
LAEALGAIENDEKTKVNGNNNGKSSYLKALDVRPVCALGPCFTGKSISAGILCEILGLT